MPELGCSASLLASFWKTPIEAIIKLPQASMPIVAKLRRERRAAFRWLSSPILSESVWLSMLWLLKWFSLAAANAIPEINSSAPAP